MCIISWLAWKIVRPPRRKYEADSLLPAKYASSFAHEAFVMETAQGNKIHASFWMNTDNAEVAAFPATSPQCIVYCHPNSSSRYEVITSRILPLAKSMQCNVACMDFTGTGHSEGDHITLAAQAEERDLALLVGFLVRNFRQQRFLLWGRSMGAVASLKFLNSFLWEGGWAAPAVFVGIVLDSPFSSVRDIVCSQASLLGAPGGCVYYLLRRRIRHLFGFDLNDASAMEACARLSALSDSLGAHAGPFPPVLVISAADDVVTPPLMVRAVFEALPRGVTRTFIGTHGTHNSRRPSDVRAVVEAFVSQAFHPPSQDEHTSATDLSAGHLLGTEQHDRCLRRAMGLALAMQASVSNACTERVKQCAAVGDTLEMQSKSKRVDNARVEMVWCREEVIDDDLNGAEEVSRVWYPLRVETVVPLRAEGAEDVWKQSPLSVSDDGMPSPSSEPGVVSCEEVRMELGAEVKMAETVVKNVGPEVACPMDSLLGHLGVAKRQASVPLSV